MYQNRVVLCASSAYEKKFYFNEDFYTLPEQVKKELKIMCAVYRRCWRHSVYGV